MNSQSKAHFISSRSSPLLSVTLSYLEEMEERYRADPASVDIGWRCVFEVLQDLQVSSGFWQSGMAAVVIASIFRGQGHLIANLSPLSLDRESISEIINPDVIANEVAKLASLMRSIGDTDDVVAYFHEIYSGTLSVETSHIDSVSLRRWICEWMERRPAPIETSSRLQALTTLIKGAEFERFLGVKYPTKKRFGAEGAEAVVVLIERILRTAAESGVTDVVVGTMHRGRLNLMANVFGKPIVELLAEFKGAHPFVSDTPISADVPYHLGLTSVLAFGDRQVSLTLAPNPSHLEAVNPVVLGRVRARQDSIEDKKKVLGLLIHTDASVIGQGVVAETVQLAGLKHFQTAGTIHIVINNQIGFTTNPDQARTSRHCTGAWKAVDSLITHVNGDDIDATVLAADLAVSFRNEFQRDAVVDLVCYRRNGHNEIDEPRFTQPLEYKLIDKQPNVESIYFGRLASEGVAGANEAERIARDYKLQLQQAYDAAGEYRHNRSGYPGGLWSEYAGNAATRTHKAVNADTLRQLIERLSCCPDDMILDRKVRRIVSQRASRIDTGLDWALAEALSFATLLVDGVPIRLSGEDAVRGTFSHRHFALTDVNTGASYVSLNGLSPNQAHFDIVNSPLSEYGVLGFEYGYSLERPDMLVIWEAQFGDFANGAQIIIDQFITSGEEKWRQPSGLVVLLPHGLEGQGPEHSSARIERLLHMGAGYNFELAHPTTPANFFHLLRRQVVRRIRKPLFVLYPKTLLRLPEAISPLADFEDKVGFKPILISGSQRQPRRVLICSGKIAYELERERDALELRDVAVLRIELLFPLPDTEIRNFALECIDAEFAWVQEEPSNFGAWQFLDRRLETIFAKAGVKEPRVACFAREASPSPAGSFHGNHDTDQRKLVEAVMKWAQSSTEHKRTKTSG